jgi:hypothetical protein
MRRFGDAAVREAFASLPSELKLGLDAGAPNFGALPSTWYDARIYHHLLEKILPTQSDLERDALAREAARAVLDETLNGIYAKLFQLMATPPLYARYAQKMWDTHYDTGTVTVEHQTPTLVRHRVRGWAGHHPFVCAVNRQSGAILYSKMGLKNVSIESQRCAPPVCESVYAWD